MDRLLSVSRNAIFPTEIRRMGEETPPNDPLERMEETENETAEARLTWRQDRKSVGQYAKSLLANREKSDLTQNPRLCILEESRAQELNGTL